MTPEEYEEQVKRLSDHLEQMRIVARLLKRAADSDIAKGKEPDVAEGVLKALKALSL